MPALLDTSVSFPPTAMRDIASDGQQHISVICAWPLSGQYGVGSRILYYILVAACVLARKSEWLRNACLAAALIVPAVAAFHGIALAALHVDDAIDLDIYGAFQLCSIGILAVPVTTRLSTTYFYDPGRNVIFLWTGIVLAGLLSLTVEFYRSNPIPCVLGEGPFPYGDTPCGLDYCVEKTGPMSPMRRGATSEIYVIPAPSALTFSTATLLAAACCIPAILYLISTWLKILELNWKSRFGTGDLQQQIEGTNGATVGGMLRINAVVTSVLSVLEILLFGGAVIAILVVGELNFGSAPMVFETELIQSVGQWAPLAGTALAIFGSLYHLLMADVDVVADEEKMTTNQSCCCSCTHHTTQQSPIYRSPSTYDGSSTRSSGSHPQVMREGFGLGVLGASGMPDEHMLHRASTIEETEGERLTLRRTFTAGDVANRRRVATAFNTMANYLGTAAHERFDDSDFKQGKAVDFPEIPGEAERSWNLQRIRKAYNPAREADGSLTPELRPQRSRSSSLNAAFVSGAIPDLALTTSRSGSLDNTQSSASASDSIMTGQTINNKPRSSTLPTDRAPHPDLDIDQRFCRSSGDRAKQKRSNTLEVPVVEYPSHIRSQLRQFAADATSSDVFSFRPGTPSIVVSSEADVTSSASQQHEHSHHACI